MGLGVYSTLHGHTERVNCVCWIAHRCHDKYTPLIEEDGEELLSGSVDKTVRIWGKDCDGNVITKKLITNR